MADLSSSFGGLLADPNSASMLGLAQGLLAASGASRLPVTMGAGLGMGLQGMQAARQGALQQQGMGLQNQLSAFNLERQRLVLGMLGNLMNGGSGQPSQSPYSLLPQPGQAPQAPFSNPVQQDQVSPQSLAPMAAQGAPQAGLMGPQDQAPMQPTPQVPQTARPANPYAALMPPGMSPQTFGLMSLLYPQAANSVVAANLTPTNNMRDAMYAAGGNAQTARSMVGGIVGKQGYIPPVRINAGGGVVMPGGQIATMPAPAPAGFQNVQLANGGWATVPVAGGTQALQTSNAVQSSGKEAGKLAFTPQTVYNPATGQQGSALGGSLYGIQAGPAGVTAGAQGSAPGGFVPTQAPIGTQQATQDLSKDYANQGLQLPGIKNSMDGLTKALDLVQSGVVTGPGSEQKYNFTGLLNTWGLPVNQNNTTNYQTAYKYLANANNNALGAMGMSGSDARMEQFLHGNPNPDTMNPQALTSAIQYVRGQQAGVMANYQAKTAWLNQHGGNYTTLPQFNAAWGKAYDPNVMVLNSLEENNPAAIPGWIKANAPKGVDPKAWTSQLNQRWQQLNAMGAF